MRPVTDVIRAASSKLIMAFTWTISRLSSQANGNVYLGRAPFDRMVHRDRCPWEEEVSITTRRNARERPIQIHPG